MSKIANTSVWAILSLIFAFLFAPLGLIFGIIALTEIKNKPKLEGRGLAIAGVVISSAWMIFFLLMILIGGLAYFGTLNPSRFLPESCVLFPGLACSDFAAYQDGRIRVIIKNGLGTDLEEFRISIDKEACSPASSTFIDGTEKTFQCDVSEFKSGEINKKMIEVEYSLNGRDYNRVGELFTLFNE